MNNEILNSIDDIIETIKSSEDYKEYIYLKEKLSRHKECKELINKIKKKQKELVKKEAHNEEFEDLNKEINKLLFELKKIPLYNEYVEKQEYLNEVYQSIKNRLDNYFYSKLN